MEIISLFVVFSIIVSVFALGMATVRLIQADDPGVEKHKGRPSVDVPSNDLIFSEGSSSKVAALRSLKVKT